MKKVYVATKTRGFLSNLFSYVFDNLEFVYEESRMYETNSKKKMILSKLVKSKIADHLGLIQRVKVTDNKCNIAFSYNRFLESNIDYVIYLENPLALVHYSTGRSRTFMSKLKLKRYLGDPHLKSIICLSKACYNTLDRFYDIPNHVCIKQVYPFIPDTDLSAKKNINVKCNNEHLQCLYVSSNFKLKGGEDILKAFNRLRETGINNVKLKIITRKEKLEKRLIKKIMLNPNIELYDFKFNKDELNDFYSNSSILLNPTRQDSFSLVVLEAMKRGNAILTTDIYALAEMVEDNYNGFLTEPRYRFFNKNNMPNEAVWNNRKETIYSDYIDENIVEFLYEKICYLNENRNILEKFALNSYEKGSKGEFSEEFIIDMWENILI